MELYNLLDEYDIDVDLFWYSNAELTALTNAVRARFFVPSPEVIADMMDGGTLESEDDSSLDETLNYLDENANCFFRPNYFKGKHGHRTPVNILKDGASKIKIPYL